MLGRHVCQFCRGLTSKTWRGLLEDFPDATLVDHLEFGWPVDYTLTQIPTPTLFNHKKDPSDYIHSSKFVNKEVSLDAMLSLFSHPPFSPWFQRHPMMTKPKKNSTYRRTIINLSFLKCRSVNVVIAKGFDLREHSHAHPFYSLRFLVMVGGPQSLLPLRPRPLSPCGFP